MSEAARFVRWRVRGALGSVLAAIACSGITAILLLGRFLVEGDGYDAKYGLACLGAFVALVFGPGLFAIILRLIEGLRPLRPWNADPGEESP